MLNCNNTVLIDCLFDRNKGTAYSNFGSDNECSRVTNCKFYKNREYVFVSANVTVSNCTFVRNHHAGGAGFGSNSLVVDCIFSNNSLFNIYGDVAAVNLYEATMKNCKIINNKMPYVYTKFVDLRGVGVSMEKSKMYNCLVTGNSGYVRNPQAKDKEVNWGSGVFSLQSEIYNCTIVNNQLPYGVGGGIHFWDHERFGTSYVYNTIVSFNSARKDSQVGGGTKYELINCHIGGGTKVVNKKKGNYHLKPTSPCINAGTNMAWMIGETDLDGNPMPTNGPINLGAFQE